MPNQRRQEKEGQSENIVQIKADLETSQLFSLCCFAGAVVMLDGCEASYRGSALFMGFFISRCSFRMTCFLKLKKS